MTKAMFVLLIFSSLCVAQTSEDGSFSVRHNRKTNFSLNPTQMREAERIYQSACAVIHREFPSGAGESHPHFTVIIGAERDEIQSRTGQGNELWMKRWDPSVFAAGVVILSFDNVLTQDVIRQLAKRTLSYSNATVDVSELK